MKLKTLDTAELAGKTILYRSPYDIGVREVNGTLEVKDDLRISATLPTLQYLLDQKCKIVILTYVKRPGGKVVEGLRTTPHARKLAELLGREVKKADDCIGKEVENMVAALGPGEILMLENTRFHPEENEDNDQFAKELCKGKDYIVFDGFPQAMRMHASTTGILRHLPAVAGRYFEKEVSTLTNLLDNPARPFTVIIGGAKISDKVDAVNNLLEIADQVLVGGAVANVCSKAQGHEMADSFIEDVFVDEKRREKKDWVEYAKEILSKHRAKIICPEDFVVSDGKEVKNINILSEPVPAGWAALDIGQGTREMFIEIIAKSKTVFMGGPMGKFEDERFRAGSRTILEAMTKISGTSIIAGGDTIDAATQQGMLDKYSHVSLAGGATLEFLAGKELPVLAALSLEP